jgi:CRISPR-associated protein Cas6
MFWEDDPPQATAVATPEILDISYAIECRELPVDHAYALYNALSEALPWFGEEALTGLHLIHVAASGNGWERPAHGGDQRLCLSRRTRMTLRIPRARLQDAETLTGKTLDVSGHRLTVGKSKTRPLSRLGTLFSRYVVAEQHDDEESFMQRMAEELAGMDIPVRKALCGIPHSLSTPDGPVFTRSLMLADLRPEDSLRLQEVGLGPHRKLGCGLFLPHKGIDPVKKPRDE